ncbi:Bicyclomycin resistance protein [Monoraphidium neglectum]|uniref:Bicyclomycin resistance protein n=1 Tax=Monoraphidium neglectum TaxID=145388 RepID=A0A0D2MM62_9CHLO|nr:Bicyclomycin resistance protein [Monoraphidium neglectum]KIZ03910.1 Bicyclomycin resistance protein [Monoraphidium neglectum]|eukprot:XP_013902929.1 Bicyclomycin resistance protein [Monoraphidium neglectum]
MGAAQHSGMALSKDISGRSVDIEAAARATQRADDGGDICATTSIFNIYSRRQKAATLLVCSLGTCLVPVSDTIYLPALAAVQRDLGTTDTLVATSVAVYMYMVGLGALLFGPTADKFGRRITLLGSTALFTALSLVTVFSKNIGMLLVLRALQGFVVSSCSTTSNAILADIFAPSERGKAMGIASIPFLVGPVIGPLLGGGLSQSLGWRSTFAALTIAGGLVLIVQLLVIQETHHFYAARRVRASKGGEAVVFVEEIHAPHFDPPYQPLWHLVDRHIAPFAIVTVTLFACMFSTMIILPIVLSLPPYSFSESIIGVATGVPFGVGGLIAAPIGGLMADRCARRWAGALEGRMVYATIMALAVFPLGALLFGWGMHFTIPAAAALLGGFFINFSMTSHMPATMSLISIHKQRYAAAAGGGLHALQFIAAGVLVQATPTGTAAMGVGPWMSMLVGVAIAVTIISGVIVVTSIRAAPAASAAGGSPAPRDEEEASAVGPSSSQGPAPPVASSDLGSHGTGRPGSPLSPPRARSSDAPDVPSRGGSQPQRRASAELALEALEGIQGVQGA